MSQNSIYVLLIYVLERNLKSEIFPQELPCPPSGLKSAIFDSDTCAVEVFQFSNEDVISTFVSAAPLSIRVYMLLPWIQVIKECF